MISPNKITKSALAALALSTVASSCTKDTVDPVTPVADKPYVVTMAYAPATGFDYSYFTVPFKDLLNGPISARGQGTEQVGYFDYKKIGNTLYSIGGLNDVKVTAIRQNANSELTETGTNAFPKAISDIVEADENNLLAVSVDRATNMISFYQLAKNTVTTTKTVQTPTANLYTPGTDLGLEYTGMAISGNKVFLSYYVINTSTFATPQTTQAEIAVYSYPELQFQKVIRDSRVGPIGGFNTKTGLVKDEAGNVYAISHSNPANGFSQSPKPAGILKIAAGSSDFDANYFLDINSKASGANAVHLMYMQDGKAFAKLNITPRGSQTNWSDGQLKAAVIDLKNQTVNMVNNLPAHNGSGRRLPAFAEGNYVYTVVPETNNGTTENYIYQINTTTFTAVKGAQAQASFVAGVYKF